MNRSIETAAQNWQYQDDNTTQRPVAAHNHMEQARSLLEADGPWPNTTMVHFIANAINTYRDGQLANVPADTKHIATLDNALARPDLDASVRQTLEGHLASRQSTMNARSNYEGSAVTNGIIRDVSQEVAAQERTAVAAAAQARVEADRFPWTMPGSDLPPAVMDAVHTVYDNLTAPPEPQPNDEYKVPHTMKRFDTEHGYCPEDEQLLANAYTDPDRSSSLPSNRFSRSELQQAGVFFLNRVGDGEQPIFGQPIPDPNRPGGYFNVQDRSFLTRSEFEQVYDYQQANGMGLKPGQDPNDVQMDMIVFGAMPDGRRPEFKKSSGFGGSRENKYGQTRSPFVDQGFVVRRGIETVIFGAELRMNTTTIHLANGHPDYPGVSEMFDSDKVAHDQRYISVGEFIDTFYLPPPTEEQAFNSIRTNTPTARERTWVQHGDRWAVV